MRTRTLSHTFSSGPGRMRRSPVASSLGSILQRRTPKAFGEPRSGGRRIDIPYAFPTGSWESRVSRRIGLTFRPLAPKETDFEFLFLTVSSGFVASCFAWLSLGLPWPGCLFRRLTGMPCPTCGATRCAMALAHGDLLGAMRHNPLMFVCYGLTVVVNVYAAVVLLFRLPRLRLPSLPAKVKRALSVLVVLGLGANWIYLIAHR